MNPQKIVIASPVPATPTKRFLNAMPKNYDWLIADDSNGKLKLPERKNIFSYDYKSQKKILGKFYDEFTVFFKSSACRNFVHFLAYKQDYDFVVSLDYDCVVPKDFIMSHLEAFKSDNKLTGVKTASGWINPLENSQWFSRGFPYDQRDNYGTLKTSKSKGRVVLNMGLWENVVDINAIDKVLEKPPKKFKIKREHTAVMGLVPLSGMNNSFLKEIIPAYLFLPNFKVGKWEVSRHDDIWGGYILQKLIQKRGDLITYGKPIIFHERESYQPRVLYHEHYTHILEPFFRELVDEAVSDVRTGDYVSMFAHFSENFERQLQKNRNKIPSHYFKSFEYLVRSMKLWTKLFQKL
ncbi:MAG: hypothetical protein NTX96_00865 [Candidatus Zambryskibacteria bacterium]|nr:hypothetical protein [Candidatus Zambryskibacteria bacterium]